MILRAAMLPVRTLRRVPDQARRVVQAAGRRVIASVTSPQFSARLGRRLTSTRGAQPPEGKLETVRRILVVRLDLIGDIVLSTPFLRELRANCPNAHITLVVRPAVHSLLELCPYVNELLAFEPARSAGLRAYLRIVAYAVRHLLSRRFELAILPRWDADQYYASHMICLSGAPVRVGFSEAVNEWKASLNPGYDQMFSHVLSDTELRHEALRSLRIIEFLGGHVSDDHLELWLSPDDHVAADELLGAGAGKTDTIFIAMVPGASEERKRWPERSFAELARELIAGHDVRVVLLGSNADSAIAHALQQHVGDGLLNLVGRTTVRTAAAILKRCALCIANDTGPMHLAAAVGVPVVQLTCHARTGLGSHRYSPARFGPWRTPHTSLQPDRFIPPCEDGCVASTPHCITGIPVETATVAALEQLRARLVIT